MHMIIIKGIGSKVSKNYDRQKAIQSEVAKTWREVLPILNKRYPRFEEKHGFNVSLNSRLRTTGGRVLYNADTGHMRMELNEKLLATNLDHVRMVFIHELAHLIQFHHRGYSDHGAEFQIIMESLGCEAVTFMPSGLDRSLFKKCVKKEYIYTCEQGCVHNISIRAHNDILKRGATYTCKNTKKALKFKEITKTEDNNFIGR